MTTTTTPARLWLVRHGPVDCAPGLCYGASDVAASLKDSREIARRIALLLPPQVELFCSPLGRCAQLALVLEGQRPDLQAQFDTRMAEMSLGAWEGRLWSDIDRGEFDAWMADFGHARAGGSGESTQAFMARVGAAYDGWRAAGQDAAWITHAGVIRAVLLLHDGVRSVSQAGQWPKRALGFGEVVQLEVP